MNIKEKEINKQELINEITKTKEHLANMEKMLAECEHERWEPEKGEQYYYVSLIGIVVQDVWCDTECDNQLWLAYNVFKTKKQAEAEAEKILIRRMLEDIAKRLNRWEKIDWHSCNQEKHWLSYDFVENRICIRSNRAVKEEGATYCLTRYFRDVAIQEIGEERLKKYLRGE